MSSDSNKVVRMFTTPRFSEVVIHNNTVYLAGQCPDDGLDAGDMRLQTFSVFRQIDEFLAKAGSDKTKILSCQIFITDIDNLYILNECWEQWMPLGSAPARASMAVNRLADPRWLLEICVTAAA